VSRDLRRTLARHWILGVPVLLGLVLRASSDAGLGVTALVGLVAVVAVYVVCVRWGCWRWLAALSAIPAAVDDRMLLDQPSAAAYGLLLVSAGLVAWSWRGLEARWTVVGASAVLTVAGTALGLTADLVSADPGVSSVHLGGGPLVDVARLLAVLAVFGVGRTAPADLRAAVAAAVAVGIANDVNVLAWWPVAASLGLTALLRGRRGKAAARPQQDDVDHVAVAEFGQSYGAPALGPVVIVIAAYDEAEGIPAVLAKLPSEVCGLHADVVVVDDGSTDGTAAALRDSRAYVAPCRTNRGQGAALRLGYRIAREHGASYVITTDADGQYSVADMPAALTPILEGRADFVSGSRILGHQQTRDRVRRAGVHVFAWLATLFTGHRFTDTSFGLRAMRAEVTGAVTLNQRQYQSSELLLGVVSHGYRVLEVPASMNLRSAGASKKGRNLVYGRRYARAMVGTWLREGLPRPVTETAPALRQTR
jgi:glycosyl transferase family 2